MLEQLLGGVVTPSVIIDLLPGHEGYTVSLSKHAGMRIYDSLKNETFENVHAKIWCCKFNLAHAYYHVPYSAKF